MLNKVKSRAKFESEVRVMLDKSLGEEGFEKIDGYTQAASALSAYLKEGRPEWFTRDNNGRFYLIKYCTKDLAREAIKNHYEKDINYEDSNLVRDICNKYVKEVVSSRRVEHLNSGY